MAYLGDDDLWFPEHLTVLSQLLFDCGFDFGHTLHIGFDAQGDLFALPAVWKIQIFAIKC